MALWSGISMRAAVAALGMAALFALAPSNVSAHGGHHTGHVHPSDLKHVEVQAVSHGAAAEQRIVEVSAAPVLPAVDHADHSDCGDRGCCANGHCGSFCGAIAPAWLLVFAGSAQTPHLNSNASPPAGLATDGPARPPRSIV